MKNESGHLVVITGSMFAGKSEELIRLVRRALYARKKVQVFKSALDDRYSSSDVTTHNGVTLSAVRVKSAKDLASRIEKDTDVVAVEEVQFFEPQIVDLCQRLADQNKTVIVSGLDQDFRGVPFGFMPMLLAVADEVVKLRAICVRCGRPASKTQRIVDGRPAYWDDPVILIGASEKYEARCRRCHRVEKRRSARRRT